MADREWKTLVEGGSFFEGPRWHDGRWWVSDFYRHQVLTVTTDGVERPEFEVGGQPSGLGWLPDGSLLVVSMKDHLLLRRTDGELRTHADLGPYAGGVLNDLVVDTAGRAYVGNFGFDLMTGGTPATTVLVRVDPDGAVTVAADDLYFPNGTVITPDGGTLIVGETMGCAYTAFTVGADGGLSDRRIWAELAPRPALGGGLAETFGQIAVGPDGCCLDAEGAIWFADAMGGRAVRVAEGGAILDEVALPAGLGAFACMLGDDDRRTLLVCAAPDFAEEARSAKAEALLLTTRVDVPGAGLP